MFFQWMVFNLIKKINRLRKEIDGLLRNVFNSIKEINRLKKEISRLLSKGKPNIYLNVTIETFSKLRFSGFSKICHQVSFVELQLTQISLNFETSCCNVKARRLRGKLCVAFLLF